VIAGAPRGSEGRLSVVEGSVNLILYRALAAGLGVSLLAAAGASARGAADGLPGPRSSGSIRISVSVAPRLDPARLAAAAEAAQAGLRQPGLHALPGGLR
jgi:hypothetical protein